MPLKHQNTKAALQLIPFVLLCFCGQTFAQQNKIASIELKDVVSAYVDRPGDIYILQQNNHFHKFDLQGNTILDKQLTQSPTYFDPRDGARMFLYQKENNQFTFYSEETEQKFSLEPQYAIDPALVCSSGDHNIWLFDQSDASIKRINPSQSKVLVESLIDQKQFTGKPDFVFMREYQNFLFILDKNSGILIFNSLGIQIKKISITSIEYFNFLGEELYYKKNDKLILHDLFDSSIRELPIDPTCKFALLTDRRKFLVYPNRLDIFETP
jgi:hypothetical protein